jgi:hypothetical protein
MTYGHAERNRIAAQLAIAETIELLLRLPSLDEEQVQFVQLPEPAMRAIRSDARHLRVSRRDHQ